MSAQPSEVKKSTPRRQARSPLNIVRRNRKRLIKRATSRRVAPLAVVGAIFVAGTIFTVLLSQVVLAQSGFKMAKLREDILAAEEENAALMLRAARLNSSERIERYAITRLGMVYPTAVPEYIVANVRTKSFDRLAGTVTEPSLPATGQAAAGFEEDAP